MSTNKIKNQNFYKFCKSVFDDVYVYRDETFVDDAFKTVVAILCVQLGGREKTIEKMNEIGLKEFLANDCIENYFNRGVSVVKQIKSFLYKNGIKVNDPYAFSLINKPYELRIKIMPIEKWGVIGNGVYENKKTCYNYLNGERRDALLFLLAAGAIPLEIELFDGFRDNKPIYILGRAFFGGMGIRNRDEIKDEYDVEQFKFYVFNVYYAHGGASNSLEIAKGIAKLLSVKLGVKYDVYRVESPFMGLEIPDVYYNGDAVVIFPVVNGNNDYVGYEYTMKSKYNYKWLVWNRFMTGKIVYDDYNEALNYVLEEYGYNYVENRKRCLFEYPKTIETDSKCDECGNAGFGYLYVCAYHERMECKECYYKLHKCDKCKNWVWDATRCEYCNA